MNSENDPTTSRPPYHPGVQTTNWLPPCWTVASGQVPVWPTVATNQFGQVVQQPICFMGQLPTPIQQQTYFQAPFQFAAPDPAPVKQESVNPGHQGRGRGRGGGSFRRGGPQSFRNRPQLRQDPPVQVRAPQTEAEAEEVRQWINQRKKNFPRLENPKIQDPVGSNSDRAKELKKILARQQEMGVTGIAGTEKLLHQMGSNRPGKIAGCRIFDDSVFVDCSRRGPHGGNKRRRFNQGENQGKRILQKVRIIKCLILSFNWLLGLVWKETYCKEANVLVGETTV